MANETQQEGIPIPRPPKEPGDDSERFNIEMHMVESSNIDKIGYQPDLQILQIAFKNGGVYQFFNVPVETYERMRDSESVGKFFHASIKNQYAGDKIAKDSERKIDGTRIDVTVYKIESEYSVSVPRAPGMEGDPTREEIMKAQEEAMLIVQKGHEFMKGRPPGRSILAVC